MCQQISNNYVLSFYLLMQGNGVDRFGKKCNGILDVGRYVERFEIKEYKRNHF